MAENENFNQKIILAVSEREKWYDNVELPKIQEDYRLHLSCVRTIFENLVKRSLIVPDPYKNDGKISEITLPETDVFNEIERATVLGLRLSNYETMIDYVCNFMKFSVSQLKINKIETLIKLNNTFSWTSLSVNSTQPNTKFLAIAINDLKGNAQPLVFSLIQDSLSKTQTAMEEINKSLKDLINFRRELYKVEIRKNILESPKFDKEKAYSSSGAMLGEIKRLFSSCMEKVPFVNDLVGEIIAEELSNEKSGLQSSLLNKMKIKEDVKEEKPSVDTHAVLMDAIRIIGTTSDSFKHIVDKIDANNEVLQSKKKSFKDIFMRLIRNIFGLEEPPVDYEIFIKDKTTDTKRKEVLHFNKFSDNLLKKSKIYASFSAPNLPGYIKLASQPDSSIFDYLTKQSVENNHIFAQLVALDEFFKQAAGPLDRSKIKGISMELTTIKNIIVKSNQYKAEYTSYMEEQEQMKRLGIS